MNPKYVALLNQHRVTLIRDMQPDIVVDHLLGSGALLDHHENEIMKKQSSEDRNRELIRILKQQETCPFQKFIDALKKTNQHDLINKFLRTTEENFSSKRMKLSIAEQGSMENFKASQSALKCIYKNNFQKVNPFSLPFTFDIEKTWVSLALLKNSSSGKPRERRMENHCQLIEEAFKDGKELLLIEGRPACGKTSLMRRIAYDWAIGKLNCYDFAIYVELRHIKEEEFQTIAELTQDGFRNFQEESIRQLIDNIKHQNFCKENRLLVLLDGFDEARIKMPCVQLSNLFSSRNLREQLGFHIIITTRPGPLSKHMNREDILNSAIVLGFDEQEQKLAYINAHFHETQDSQTKSNAVERCLVESPALNEIAETPLFLVFICLVYDKITKKTVFELYQCIIWWLIDRYQADHSALNVPALFGLQKDENEFKEQENWRTIQSHFLEFPLLRQLGIFAFELFGKNIFSTADLNKYKLDEIITNVGFLRREENYIDLRLETQLVFPHRTIQEFLAGGTFYYWPDSGAKNDKLVKTVFSTNLSFMKMEEDESDSGSVKSEMSEEERAESESDQEKEQLDYQREMNELEKFIWRAAFTLDDAISTRLDSCFPLYESLILDLSLVFTQPESIKYFNKFLKVCRNMKQICFYYQNDDEQREVVVDGRIDLSNMNSLHSIAFDGRTNTQQLRFDIKIKPSIKAQATMFRLLELPMNMSKTITEVVLSNLFFYNAQCFIETMRYLAENADSEAKLIYSRARI